MYKLPQRERKERKGRKREYNWMKQKGRYKNGSNWCKQGKEKREKKGKKREEKRREEKRKGMKIDYKC